MSKKFTLQELIDGPNGKCGAKLVLNEGDANLREELITFAQNHRPAGAERAANQLVAKRTMGSNKRSILPKATYRLAMIRRDYTDDFNQLVGITNQ